MTTQAKKNICANCQYYRDGQWCSNSKSPHNRQNVADSDTCSEFYKRGKKAPLGMRLIIKALEKMQGK